MRDMSRDFLRLYNYTLEDVALIRHAILDDAPRIAEINVCGWRYAYRDILSDYELFCKRQIIKTIEHIEATIVDGSTILINEEDEIIKGYAWYGLASSSEKPNAFEIYSIYVQPEFTRRNIGTELLRAIEHEGEKEQKDEIMLWVLKKNNKGINFYRKNGYDEDGMIKLILEWKEIQIRMIKRIN